MNFEELLKVGKAVLLVSSACTRTLLDTPNLLFIARFFKYE